jgi:hypothetical protein
MKTIPVIVVAAFFSGLLDAQTVFPVRSVVENFEQDEGVVMMGKVTGEANPKNDDREYSFTDNDTHFIRIEIGTGLPLPQIGQTMTVCGIMDMDNPVKEVDVKYWHMGDSSIVDKLGMKSVKWLTENSVDMMHFAVLGKVTGFTKNEWEYNFKDPTGIMAILIHPNSFPPDFNKDMLCIGRVDKVDESNTDYYTFYREYYSGTPSGITSGHQDDLLSVYPNPAGRYFSVNRGGVPGDHGDITSIRIINLLGKTARVYRPDAANHYYIGDMPAGFYFVSIGDKRRTIATLPLVKQ